MASAPRSPATDTTPSPFACPLTLASLGPGRLAREMCPQTRQIQGQSDRFP